MGTTQTCIEPRPALDDHETWRKIRNAICKRLQLFGKGVGAHRDYSDIDDAAQDAFLRVIVLFDKHPDKSIGCCIVWACRDERRHCYRGKMSFAYRPACEKKESVPPGHWSKRFDPSRYHNAGVGDATRRASRGLPMNVDESRLLAEYPNRMRTYFEGGASIVSIAETFGVKATAVRKVADAQGWTPPEKTKTANAMRALRRVADMLNE